MCRDSYIADMALGVSTSTLELTKILTALLSTCQAAAFSKAALGENTGMIRTQLTQNWNKGCKRIRGLVRIGIAFTRKAMLKFVRYWSSKNVVLKDCRVNKRCLCQYPAD